MKRRMPPHVVLPNGMWRFVKKGTKTRSKGHSRRKIRVVHSMAKRRRSYSRRSGGFGLGSFGSIFNKLKPAIGGAADRVAPPIMGIHGYASFLTGMFLKDPITTGIGAYNIGYSGADKLLGGVLGNGGGASGGFQ